MAYSVKFKKSVWKDLNALDRSEARRILQKIERDLPERADQCPALTGPFAGLRKLRIGNYRVVFALLGTDALVLRVGHRKDVYR